MDSVAEHQAASDSAYWQYLHHCKTLSILGWFLCFWKTNPAKSFIVGYGL